MGKVINEVSKFLSYVLRHEPQSIKLMLDRDGWAVIDDLIAGAIESGRNLDYSLIQDVVLSSDKQRFEISSDGRRIRAVQGHSTSLVDREYSELEPPQFLYHGTATRFLDSIRNQGLVAGSRHYVHLTQNKLTARAVGQRYGVPVLLRVSSLEMFSKGFKFFKAENDVWLTISVPAEFLTKEE
ncbi:RNA 2'-phosphotransferase [Pseudomonas fluorescens]|uniref:RNA 2'-phosphotransferase n=1 Tax=Pseudomonas fluorescens TaxID=294 RepID=UPI003D059CB6